ncbi:MAG: 50S ribosomal protein L6, partial [Planctomycetota bacterium]
IPEGVTVDCPTNTMIKATGCDKAVLGQFAANVRRVRPPEPYNGKGIRYRGEQVQRKAGKSFVSSD